MYRRISGLIRLITVKIFNFILYIFNNNIDFIFMAFWLHANIGDIIVSDSFF